MIAAATAHEYGETVRILGGSGEVDALLVIFNTPLLTSAADVAKELVSARAGLDPGVALLAVFMNKQGPPQALRDACLPAFSYPENAVRALARSVTWAERRRRPQGEVLRPEVDAERIDLLVAEAKGRSRNGWLAAGDAESLLAAYGVALPRVLRVRSPEEAAAAQDKLGSTTVVKIAATVHKSDVGGVRLGITTPAGAAEAVRSIREGLTAAGMAVMATEFLVQEQVGPGLEMIVGARKDPVLGPLVMVGLGGTLVELLGDVAVRLAPLSDLDVEDMLSALKCYRLLTGFRGTPALDVAALSRVLHAVSALSEDLPDLVELDLNPVFVLEKGAVAADVRLRLGSGAGNDGGLPIH
jgi:acyl-CoA synthetase (NDP forming)